MVDGGRFELTYLSESIEKKLSIINPSEECYEHNRIIEFIERNMDALSKK
jgi:hypothetical protein